MATRTTIERPAADAGLARRFLTAEWRRLVMINYRVDRELLEPLVPAGVALDDWHGTIYASMVGFLFLDTRLGGLPIPGYRRFEEVNLRFYVRRETADEVRRGVVFVKEIVPKRAIAWTARLAYNENYAAMPMRHSPDDWGSSLGETSIGYEWRTGGRWNRLAATPCGPVSPLVEGSQEQFIAEHYWGYCRQRDGGTIEYRVEHPSWNAVSAKNVEFDCDVAGLYGPQFVEALGGGPESAFIADGSEIAVRRPVRIV